MQCIKIYMATIFNYVITIHNKENILPRTLAGISASCGSASRIYPVLDGCTDGSEAIVQEFARTSGLDVRILYAPDVHMLKSVNTALREIKEGFTIIVQDDVILQEPALENKLLSIYSEFGPTLGVLSLRLAANVSRMGLIRQLRRRSLAPMAREWDYIRGPDDHERNCPTVLTENLYLRMAAINGPNCIPETVLSDVGLFDENMAPYGYDDPEYCLRAMKAGYHNGLFPLRFCSELDWGGTRQDKNFGKRSRAIWRRNLQYLWKLHGAFVNELWRSGRVPTGTSPWRGGSSDASGGPGVSQSLRRVARTRGR
jgi:GT2 family glycosyltransferase